MDAQDSEPPEGCRLSPDLEGAWTEGDGAKEPPRLPNSTGYDSTETLRLPNSKEHDATDPDSTYYDSTQPNSAECDSDEPDRPPDSTYSDSTEPDSTEYDSDEPRHPLDSECCGSGCSPCVFDLYDRDLAAWRRRREQRRTAGSANPSASSSSSAITAAAGPLRPDHFTALPLVSITAVSDTASLYRFLLPSGASLHLPPGGHLRLRTSDLAGRVITRAYTPVSPPQTDGYFEVYVRRYAAGAMSACVRRWRPGQLALWSGPFGGYRPRPGDARLVLLAAGTGVAPFVGLVRAAVEDEESETWLTLLLAVRRLQDVFPRRELTQWTRYWNFTYQLFVSGSREETGEEAGQGAAEGAADAWYGEPVRWRRLERQDVQEVVRQPAGRTRYLVCGTRSFEKDVLNHLRVAGVEDEDVFRF